MSLGPWCSLAGAAFSPHPFDLGSSPGAGLPEEGVGMDKRGRGCDGAGEEEEEEEEKKKKLK